MKFLHLLVAATALGMASQASAAAPADAVRTITSPRVNVLDRVTGQRRSMLRCGFENPSTAERMDIAAKLRQFRDSNRSLVQGVTVADRIIPVHFHVITTNTGAGNVSDAQLTKQLAVLNAAYAGSGFQFSKQGFSRTKNTTWYNSCDKTTVERTIRRALAVDPAHTFNVYLCGLGAGLLGRATLPSYFVENNYMHGVVIHNGTVPDGAFSGYNGGDTLVHETGHYLGLYHTFQGGCSEPGDEVADTPAEESPDYFCEAGRDTCKLSAGLDPNKNYMDYGNDACMTSFSTDQRIRAQDQVSLYKPSLGH
jgi:hypothetical protein